MTEQHIIQPTLPAHDYQAAGNGSDYLPQLKLIFSESRLLDVFEDDAIRILASHIKVYRQQAGKPLLREGEKSDFVLMLIEGEVDVLKSNDNGAPQMITSVLSGKLIGEMSLVDGEPRFATCIARSNVLVAVLTRTSLLAIIDSHPRLGAQLLMQLVALISQRLRQTSKKLVSVMTRGAA